MTNIMIRHPFKGIGVVFLAVTLLSGCGLYRGLTRTTEKIGESISGKDGSIHKKVGVTPLKNLSANVKVSLAEQIQSDFQNKLNAFCADVIWVGPGNSNYPDFIRNPALSARGDIDNLVLAQAGRKNGYQAILQLSLLNVDVHQYDKGVLWFKKTHQNGRLLWSVVIYDSETGAKLYNSSYPHDFKTNSDDIESIRQARLNEVSGLPEAIDRSLADITKEVCKALKQTEWKGFITRVSGDVITLSSGADAGLAVGQELTAHGPGETITGASGQSYLMRGKNLGKIRITRVTADQAEAEAVGDAAVQTGGMVLTR